ncbi:electron transport complex subunit E [Halorhodospira halochloris]|uniref:Ion-translocating oxidoreductase complex subunit E n=2 Tax=Halorhodospira halochloris TaxID=1052 RepID=A0A0X8X7U5_HALHR|nr:electron transport complex subunit E [Halorhodospira halochloris]MBK1651589.1 electron transport complex subunit RsxE [Halorhodospira halochloris]MCG5531340.1 electron transport complex subunit E [Halorhodospira halochloris]BAU57140.1 electron transport complex protein RnfE [Halorhodospira halochloris]
MSANPPPSSKAIWYEGLWKNNAALVQLLGLCPLLAVTTTAMAGLGLGIATLLVVTASSIVVSLIRNWVPQDVRIPVFILIIASFVTIVELLVAAWLHDLYRTLGLFLPLIVTNCAILARAEAFASRQPVAPAALDGLATGAGFAAVLVVLGAMRELLGRGTLLDGADQLFGDIAANWTIELVDGDLFLLAILPPGAFIGLAVLLALKNRIEDRS